MECFFLKCVLQTYILTYIHTYIHIHRKKIDPDVHQQAAAALRGLAVTYTNKMKIVQEGEIINTSSFVFYLSFIFRCTCSFGSFVGIR